MGCVSERSLISEGILNRSCCLGKEGFCWLGKVCLMVRVKWDLVLGTSRDKVWFGKAI